MSENESTDPHAPLIQWLTELFEDEDAPLCERLDAAEILVRYTKAWTPKGTSAGEKGRNTLRDIHRKLTEIALEVSETNADTIRAARLVLL